MITFKFYLRKDEVLYGFNYPGGKRNFNFDHSGNSIITVSTQNVLQPKTQKVKTFRVFRTSYVFPQKTE